ncbi:hypothetical protein V1281_000722 [Nitrobacteraceae bacterium AZCC 2161]
MGALSWFVFDERTNIRDAKSALNLSVERALLVSWMTIMRVLSRPRSSATA